MAQHGSMAASRPLLPFAFFAPAPAPKNGSSPLEPDDDGKHPHKGWPQVAGETATDDGRKNG